MMKKKRLECYVVVIVIIVVDGGAVGCCYCTHTHMMRSSHSQAVRFQSQPHLQVGPF